MLKNLDKSKHVYIYSHFERLLKKSMFDTFKNNWKISVIETGSFKLDGGAMMGSVPKVLWEKTNPCDDLNRIDLSMRCLLLDNGKRQNIS